MAEKFAARKNSSQSVVSATPSVENTPRGNSVVPVGYSVKEDLSGSSGTVSSVLVNGDASYTMASNTSKMVGDEQGSLGGVVSGTQGTKSEPTQHSGSVRKEGKYTIRCDDQHKVVDGNTAGFVQCSGSASEEDVVDTDENGNCPEGYVDNCPQENHAPGEPIVIIVCGGSPCRKMTHEEQVKKVFKKEFKDELKEFEKMKNDPVGYAKEKAEAAIKDAKEKYEAAQQAAQRWKDNPLAEAGAIKDRVGDEISEIGGDLEDWGDEQSEKYGEIYKDLGKDDWQVSASKLGAAVLGTAKDIFNPGKKLEKLNKITDAILGKKKKKKSGKTDKKDGEKNEGKKKCARIEINIRCDGEYPANVPKPKNGCALVRQGKRPRGINKHKSFNDAWKKGKTSEKQNHFFEKTMGVNKGELNDWDTKTLKTNTDSLPYHHIRPLWAGGVDGASNLIPLQAKDHTGEGSAHRWWIDQVNKKQKEIQKKINKCLKKKKSKKTIKHGFGEQGMTKSAEKLGKQGVKMKLCLKGCE